VGDLLWRERGINQHLSASLGNGGSNAVQITLTIDGDLASTIFQKEQKKGKGISLNDRYSWYGQKIVVRNTLLSKKLKVGKMDVPVLISLQDVNLLQGLENLASNGAGGLDVVGGAGTAVDGTTVELLEGTDTNAAAEVDVAGNGSYRSIRDNERTIS
jgi:hypothetical protein